MAGFEGAGGDFGFEGDVAGGAFAFGCFAFDEGFGGGDPAFASRVGRVLQLPLDRQHLFGDHVEVAALGVEGGVEGGFGVADAGGGFVGERRRVGGVHRRFEGRCGAGGAGAVFGDEAELVFGAGLELAAEAEEGFDRDRGARFGAFDFADEAAGAWDPVSGANRAVIEVPGGVGGFARGAVGVDLAAELEGGDADFGGFLGRDRGGVVGEGERGEGEGEGRHHGNHGKAESGVLRTRALS